MGVGAVRGSSSSWRVWPASKDGCGFFEDLAVVKPDLPKDILVSDLVLVADDAYGFNEECETVVGEWLRQTSLASSRGLDFALPAETLVFFDWDDTLFPSAVLGSLVCRGISLDPGDPLQPALSLWRRALVDYLGEACKLSAQVVILTNAKRPWVSRCVELFIPELRCILDGIGGPTVSYANEVAAAGNRWRLRSECVHPVRRRHPEEHHERTDDLMRNKRLAMMFHAKKFYSGYPGQTWKNVLSLGDSRYERNALQDLKFGCSSGSKKTLRTKTLLLPTAPRLSEITLRLRFSKLMLPAYVSFDGDIDLDLQAADDPLVAIADALDMPEVKAISFPRHAWGRDAPPKESEALIALDEMASAVHGA